jgi:putative membrane protein
MLMVVKILVALIALLHVWAAVLEMFLWTRPIGLRTFGMTRETAEASAVLAKNQGLYNLFLVAGLVLGLVLAEPQAGALRFYSLACVAAAGLYGGLTAKRALIFTQAGPAIVALVLSFI